MAGEKKSNDQQSDDVVKRDDYNKVVESRNSLKSELEQKEKELAKFKEEKEEDKLKAEWQEELKKRDAQIEELKTKMEKKESGTVAKGLVATPKKEEGTPSASESEAIKKLKELVPPLTKDPQNFASNLARFRYYKSPVTKPYNDEQIGMILNLHADATRTNPALVKNEAKIQARDIPFRRAD